MKEKIRNIVKKLMQGEYYMRKTIGLKGEELFTVYTGSQVVVMRLKEHHLKKVMQVFKKDKKSGKITINLNLVRQQHGNTVVKKIYKKKESNCHSQE